MANENDVVRLKHLQPLVSGVANDFSIQNGDNAVRLKHLVSLASALDNDKQVPVLSLGSWSSADTVYSAPITYTGDGTLSTDIGTISNDILTVEDVDGNFSGVISASDTANYYSTSLNFFYKKHTPTGTVTVPTVEKTEPTITIEVDGDTATINYDGDGLLMYIVSFEVDVIEYNFEGLESNDLPIEVTIETGQTIIAFAEATEQCTAAVAVYTAE